jgi:hypothetical protein
MLKDGFRVTGIDGYVERAGYPSKFPRPPTLRGIRPDACGLHHTEELYGFVEAKTERDIDNSHTRGQLRELGGLLMSGSGKHCPVYVVIPRGAAYALDRVLNDIGLLRATHIRRLHIPSALLEA